MNPYAKSAIVALGLIGLSQAACATDLAVLRNGFTIRCQRREVRAEVTRLYPGKSDDSFVDVPTANILRFEIEEEPVKEAAIPEPVAAAPVNLDKVITAASRRHQLDPDFVHSLIRAESAFNPKAVSPKGALGLMQLMPSTAKALGVSDPLDPQENVEGGTRYIRELLARYGNNPQLALAAYNAGPEQVARYGGIPPYRETWSYVARVMNDFTRTKRSAPQQARKLDSLKKRRAEAPPAE